jgi:hypothetical protein
MEERPHTAEDSKTAPEPAPSQDMADILERLSRSGAGDDVSRLMDVYEAGERQYRASVQSRAQTVRSSASTSL